MFYIHGDEGEGRSIDISYPPIHWSVKSFMIFKGLAYMTADYVHSYMVGYVGVVKFFCRVRTHLDIPMCPPKIDE